MLRTFRGLRFAALAVASISTLSAAAAPIAPSAPTATLPFHTKLVKSAPAANDTLATAPTSVSLWFNEKVDLKVTTVKLTGAAGAVKTAPVARDEKLKDALDPLYASLSPEDAKATAHHIWQTINLVNLRENVLPTRERAHLILEKGRDHGVRRVRLRKV